MVPSVCAPVRCHSALLPFATDRQRSDLVRVRRLLPARLQRLVYTVVQLSVLFQLQYSLRKVLLRNCKCLLLPFIFPNIPFIHLLFTYILFFALPYPYPYPYPYSNPYLLFWSFHFLRFHSLSGFPSLLSHIFLYLYSPFPPFPIFPILCLPSNTLPFPPFPFSWVR